MAGQGLQRWKNVKTSCEQAGTVDTYGEFAAFHRTEAATSRTNKNYKHAGQKRATSVLRILIHFGNNVQ